MFPWISVVYSLWLLPASQHSVETPGAVISRGCAASTPEQGLGGAMGSGPGAGNGDLKFLPCQGLMPKEQEGMFGVMQPSPVQGTHFGFCSAACTRLPQWTENVKPRLAVRHVHPAVPLVGRLWESVQSFVPNVCRRYFTLVITIITLIRPASSKLLVYIKHLESEAKIPVLCLHYRK